MKLASVKIAAATILILTSCSVGNVSTPDDVKAAIQYDTLNMDISGEYNIASGIIVEVTEYGYNLAIDYAGINENSMRTLDKYVKSLQGQSTELNSNLIAEEFRGIKEKYQSQPKLAPLTVQLEGCSLSGSARPTSPQSGAKAFAFGNCSSGVLGWTARVSTAANAYADVPPGCSDESSAAQCSSVAYGPPSCGSRANAQEIGGGQIIRKEKIYTNIRCS